MLQNVLISITMSNGIKRIKIIFMIIKINYHEDHLPPAKHIISSLAHAAPGLSVPRLPSPGREVYDDVEVDDDDGVDDDVPEKLVVDDDGVDEVESKEPEEETRDPAGKLIMVVIVLIVLMNMLTCNSSREVAV